MRDRERLAPGELSQLAGKNVLVCFRLSGVRGVWLGGLSFFKGMSLFDGL